MKLRLESFISLLPQRLLDKPAGVAAIGTQEPFGFEAGRSIRGDDDFDCLAQ